MIAKKTLFVLIFSLFLRTAFSQNYQIHWVEKAKNPSFFEQGKELPALLIVAVRNKKIKPYQISANEQLGQEMSGQDFRQNMTIPQPKGMLITEENPAAELPENAQWLLQDVNLLAIYEDVAKAGKIDFIALYVSDGEKKQFIAAFKFKEIEKLFKKEKAALWQYPTQANFGNVLHLDLDDGSIYRLAKLLIQNSVEKGKEISAEFQQKIMDTNLSYQWLVRPLEKKVNNKEFEPTALEVYNEDSELKLVGKFDFEQIKPLIVAKENYFFSYAEALNRKLFISNLQANLPTPLPKAKEKKLFEKQFINDLNMKDEENNVLFKPENEFANYLIEAVRKNQLIPYPNDSLQSKMQLADFEFKLTVPSGNADSDSTTSIALGIRQLYKLNLTEKMFFDQEGKRKTYQTKAISLLLPAQENALKGVDEPLCYFAYKDIVKLLKKKKQKEMLLFFENRNFKAIPIFTKPANK
ncbi:MAG: hypothetical protein EAZ08_01675 [Cytophagales bacterium]|nr:MAG: hypothetical protein EAZ08_01675 [Cytophagales bacterium]